MVTEGPISCYPITKKVPCSLQPPPPQSFLLVPPPSLPPLRKRRENRRCWDCIIASITVIIYTSILSYSLFFCLLLQSISAGSVCAAETCKEVQVVISEMTDIFFLKVSCFSCVEKSGAKGKRGTSLNQVIFLSHKSSDLCGGELARLELWRATR